MRDWLDVDSMWCHLRLRLLFSRLEIVEMMIAACCMIEWYNKHNLFAEHYVGQIVDVLYDQVRLFPASTTASRFYVQPKERCELLSCKPRGVSSMQSLHRSPPILALTTTTSLIRVALSTMVLCLPTLINFRTLRRCLTLLHGIVPYRSSYLILSTTLSLFPRSRQLSHSQFSRVVSRFGGLDVPGWRNAATEASSIRYCKFFFILSEYSCWVTVYGSC